MKTLRFFTTSLFALTLVASGFSQGNTAWKKYRHEASIGYGFNSLLMNLGEADKFGTTFMLQHSTFNLSYRYYPLKHVAVRASFSHAYARKNDKRENLETRDNLRLDYLTSLSELAFMAEYHIFDETTRGRKQGKVRRARGGMSKGINVGLSAFGGIGFNYFRPYAEYYGQKVLLRPLDPAGGAAMNPADYKKTHMVFPVGAQLRFILSENWRFGLEGGYRIGLKEYIANSSGVYYTDVNPYVDLSPYTNTDYIGYVTYEKGTGQPLSNLASNEGRTSYFFGMATLSFRIKS